ncbi:integrase catalytic domain-containing protein, partial [Trichonephila clavata]
MLESLEYKVDPTSDTLLMHMILFKLDTNSRTWFERTFPTDVIPRLDELLQFLATQARSITSSFTKRNVQRKVTLVASNAQSQCPLCNGDHTLSRCDTFLKLSVQGRSDFVKTNNVCFNCLTQFHGVKTCKSKFRCKRCKKPHHSLLHIENASARGRQGAVNVLNSSGLSVNAPVFSPVPISGSSQPSENSRVVDVTSCISDVNPDIQILLCTALIQVRDIWGNYQTCRCLLDSGSQASLITNECIERLGLRKEKANARISCLGASDTRTNGIAEIQFTPHFSSQNSFHASVYVINKIVGMIPHHDLDSSMRELFGDISLADPAFYKSSPIDVLLGVDLTLPLLRGQTLSMGKDKPFAIRSELGWIIGGKANSSGQNSLQVNHIQLVSDQLINKFWELDSVPCAKPLTSLEEACEDHFVKTHSRDENGRYTVRLPFHSPPTRLGNSKQNAIRRLVSVERHLISNPDKYKLYRNFMKEYLDLKHMELVPDSEINSSNSLYLPHHGVVRDTSCTTKLRVVFDASSKTSSGLSLNDLLMVGPRVQPELFPILIQFRIFNVAICADVEKMFRQIKTHEEDVDWQRILWRDSPTEPIKEYRLTTVTYGTSSAPFISTRTLRQLAIDEQENFSAASRATLCHFYVDDLLSGSATRKGAVQLVSELQEMMKRGGFSLRKWVSNDPDALSNIPEELKAVDSKHTIKDDQHIKILGIAWLPYVDKFTFTITVNETDVWTKRKVLSEVAKIFDPLGWLAPTVIISKIFLQDLWSHHLSWDEELPNSLARHWRIFQEQLPLLTKIKIPRCILIPQAIDVQVHGFCDSSEKAYCAAIYIRSKDATQTVISRLLTSKTRVSPVKTQSLPRLELCSALLLANLLHATLPTLTVPISETFAWSDSKITLAWLKSEPRRWQPFVAYRVAQIQELTPNVHWNFVSGLENPADCGTRGIPPTKLENCDLWFNGPDWLRNSTFPIGRFEDNPQLQEDMSTEAKGISKLIMLTVVDATFK